MRRVHLLAIGLAALTLAGCTHPEAQAIVIAAGSGDQSGGTVGDSPTTFPSFTASTLSVANDGTAIVVWRVTMRDNNSEDDVATISLFVNASGIVLSHDTTKSERKATSEPSSYGDDGWKVWTVTKDDGYLFAAYAMLIPSGTPPGTYRLGVRATSATGVLSYPPASAQLDLLVHGASVITVASAPVNATGVAQMGVSWGAWTADPGATVVASTNYLKLTNTGAHPASTVVIDFTQSVFTGATDANDTIPLDANIQFAWWEDATPASTAPDQGTYTFGAASASGAVTVAFTATTDVIYVAYRLAALPAVVRAQPYSAAFTVTDVTP